MPPPQWGSNYASQGQGYGSYGPPQSHQSGYNNSWNWNVPQGSGGAPQGGPGPNQAGPQGDIYSRSASAGAPGSAGTVPPGTGPNPKTPDYSYSNYGAYSQVAVKFKTPRPDWQIALLQCAFCFFFFPPSRTRVRMERRDGAMVQMGHQRAATARPAIRRILQCQVRNHLITRNGPPRDSQIGTQLETRIEPAVRNCGH